MNEYSLILQVCAILFLIFLGYLFIKYIIAVIKLRRISSFSLKVKEDEEKSLLFRIIFKFSKFLNSLVIFNQFSKTYDKYIFEDSRLKKGMDYVSLKILMGMLFIAFYIIITLLYKDNISSLIILLCFIIGFLIPDFYCLFKEFKRFRILDKNILGAVIIMNNSYRANGSTEQAINDVIKRCDNRVGFEFRKVLNDIKLGIDISEAFYRMYNRVRLESVLYISRMLSLVSKSGVNIIEVFDAIEKKLLNEEKFKEEISSFNEVNKISFLLFCILPLAFLLSIIVFNTNYVNLLLSDIGIFIILIVLILYLLYLFIIYRIYRGDKYDR